MKFQRRKAVSVIIATLLLIAIAVAASIIVYVFVNSLAGGLTQGGGQQTTERLQMQGYNFNLALGATCACSLQVLQVFLLNSGSAATTVSAVYYDGTLIPISANNPPLTATQASFSGVNVYTTTSATCVINSNTASQYFCVNPPVTAAQTSYAAGVTGEIEIGLSAAAQAGTSHTVKVVSSTGATYVFAVTAGRSG